MTGKIDILVSCVDCRLHNHGDGFLIKPVAEDFFKLGNSYPLLWPGPDDEEDREVIVRGVKKLSTVKDIGTVVVISHENCAGNPCDNQAHEENTSALAKALSEAVPHATVRAALAERVDDDNWRLEEVVL